MESNAKLRQEIERFRDYTVIVEGKKDVLALEGLGFRRVYAIHSEVESLRERIEEIASKISNKVKVCILTDFDKRGQKMHESVRSICQELGLKLDSRFRELLLKSGVSHVEGIYRFISRIDSL